MSPILALAMKDLRLFFKDKKGVLITFAVPIAIASFMGSLTAGLGGGGDKPMKAVPILVADSDGSELSKAVIAKMKATGMVEPTAASQADAEAKVRKGDWGVAFEIPKGFGKEAPNAMFGGKAPKLTLLYDPSKALEMQASQGAIMQATMQAVSAKAFSADSYNGGLKDIESSTSFDAHQKAAYRDLFGSLDRLKATGAQSSTDTGGDGGGGMKQPFEMNKVAATAAKTGPDYSGLAHMFAGMAMQGVLFFAIDAAMGLLRERRLGIYRRLRVAPISLGQILAGKLLGSAVLAAFVLSGVLLFGRVVFGIQVMGSMVGLGLIIGATALMTASFGLFVASMGRTEAQSRGLSVLVVLGLSMLGGAWFPAFLMPAWVQPISLATPSRWAVDGFDAMLWRGQGLSAALPSVGVLLGFTVAFAAIAMGRFATMKEA
ncbi:ABC transporter permease [soil metagenome]